jgi:hypothetical protein
VVCSSCHTGTLAFTNCTLCHGGTDNASGAPPHDVAGNTANTFRGVGAHTSHVAATHGLAVAFDCNVCHGAKPTDAFTSGHIDGTVSVPFAGVGSPGSWNGTATTCTTYCHGSTLPAGTGINRTPNWTTVNGSQITCGTSCHGTPPASGPTVNGSPAHLFHIAFLDCSDCHATANQAGNGIADPTKHVNGQVDVPAGTANWNNSNLPLGTICRNCH